jgi:indole-3-glycerol phosphate synthase
MSNAAHWSLANAAFMGAEALDFRARYEDDPEQKQLLTEAAERLRMQVLIETERRA